MVDAEMMKVYLRDGTTEFFAEIEESWIVSEVNENGDLTIYRTNQYVLSPTVLAHYAAGTWDKAI